MKESPAPWSVGTCLTFSSYFDYLDQHFLRTKRRTGRNFRSAASVPLFAHDGDGPLGVRFDCRSEMRRMSLPTHRYWLEGYEGRGAKAG